MSGKIIQQYKFDFQICGITLQKHIRNKKSQYGEIF